MSDESLSEENFLIYQKVDDVRIGKLPRRSFAKMLAKFGLSTAGVGAVIAVATTPATPTSQTNKHVGTNETQNIQLHDQHLSQQTQGDAQNLAHDYAKHAIVEDSIHAEPLIGRDAIMQHKGERMAAVSGASITVNNRIARGEQVVVEWTATGVHSGNLHGLVATGRTYTLKGVTVVIRQNGKIVRESIYYDAAELNRQLGPN
jgi:steroid delta-isomerase-like uncharacterized protein